jgi:hypothetical protein
MRERLVEDERGRKLLLRFIREQKLPFTIKITEGRLRSTEQNRLQWLWATEAAAARQDTPAKEIQAEWKLNFGVPILCAEDEEFADTWVRVENKFSYNEQLELMNFLSVTSLMTSRQLSNYLNQIYQHYSEHGIELTDPEDLRWENAKNDKAVAGQDA